MNKKTPSEHLTDIRDMLESEQTMNPAMVILIDFDERLKQMDQRLAALEGRADAAGQHDFQPGWWDDDGTAFYAGIGRSRYVDQAVRFQWYKTATVVNMMCDLNVQTVQLDVNELRKLVGAALEVLKRMEAES